MSIVLVVDDSPVDQKIAGGLLESCEMLVVSYVSSGKEALEFVSATPPDLVLTDLQMPDLDGLELVTKLGEQCPHLPVVLMTAYGSENVAAESLAAGAASFVPKTALAENLVDTVLHVLALAVADARYKKLVSCTTKTDFEFRLVNDVDLVEPLIDMIQQVSLSQGVVEQPGRVQLGVALEQALTNAMLRGNLDIQRSEFPVAGRSLVQERAESAAYADRRVYFRAIVTPEAATFTIRDDGAGFDTSTIPAPNDSASLVGDKGRGLLLMQSFMDEVTFNEKGNEVVMIHRRS